MKACNYLKLIFDRMPRLRRRSRNAAALDICTSFVTWYRNALQQPYLLSTSQVNFPCFMSFDAPSNRHAPSTSLYLESIKVMLHCILWVACFRKLWNGSLCLHQEPKLGPLYHSSSICYCLQLRAIIRRSASQFHPKSSLHPPKKCARPILSPRRWIATWFNESSKQRAHKIQNVENHFRGPKIESIIAPPCLIFSLIYL